MKFTKKDIVRLLWQFNQLELEIIDDTLITKVSVSHPEPTNTLLAFRFEGKPYFALFEEDATVDPAAFDGFVRRGAFANIGELKLIGVDRFRGKKIYLARELVSKWRLDVFLAANAAELGAAGELNRSAAQRLTKAGRVKVNGAVATSNSLMVGKTDDISVDWPVANTETRDFPVIYEDQDVVVIDKPAGVLTHAKGEATTEPTVADFVRRKWDSKTPASQEVDSNRLGIVHRLDRGTSGVLIAGKNPAAVKKLQKQFAERKAKKTYHAVVSGVLKQDKAVIRLPIARNAKRPTTFIVSPEGKEAETLYEAIKTSPDGRYSLLKLTPKTGRTHQLRVHLAHIGHPIVGDGAYGGIAMQVHGDRLLLHAAELEIILLSGERKAFKSKPPKEFAEYVD